MPERKKRRVDIRGILANPDLRRELMVPALQATQARERIETSREQAERAYYVVTEAERVAFFALERFRGGRGTTDRRHERFASALGRDVEDVRFDVSRRDFAAIDGAPLAYRGIGLVSHLFREAPSVEPSYADVRQGLSTADDERFVRRRWEIPSDRIGAKSDWWTFAKGGDFCRFYQSFDLVVLWRESGRDIKAYNETLYGKGSWSRQVRSEELYGRAGLTWPRRTQRGFNIRRMPYGCIFADKGPAVFPRAEQDTYWLLGVLSSVVVEFILRSLMSFGSWEVGVIKRLPIPQSTSKQHERIGSLAKAIHDAKAAWDEGNEISTRFTMPWLLRDDVVDGGGLIAKRLEKLAELEGVEENGIQSLYEELNNEVYKLYGIPSSTRTIIEETSGEPPPEVIWPQMEGQSVEQKRMEHVFRMLSYVVKRLLEADEDGIVPFAPVHGEASLLDRVVRELHALFPEHEAGQVEAEIANELKKSVKSYRRTASIGEWLANAFFEFHSSLYKARPIFWHIASARGTAPFAFGALVHYHRFDKNRMAKLRGTHLRDAMETFRREAALADKEGRAEDKVEWQAKLEEAQGLDRRLQLIQEGQYPIRTPWKKENERPHGWDPDLDDGVKVNIEPFVEAGVLR